MQGDIHTPGDIVSKQPFFKGFVVSIRGVVSTVDVLFKTLGWIWKKNTRHVRDTDTCMKIHVNSMNL